MKGTAIFNRDLVSETSRSRWAVAVAIGNRGSFLKAFYFCLATAFKRSAFSAMKPVASSWL
jgi:hypothetical protein